MIVIMAGIGKQNKINKKKLLDNKFANLVILIYLLQLCNKIIVDSFIIKFRIIKS